MFKKPKISVKNSSAGRDQIIVETYIDQRPINDTPEISLEEAQALLAQMPVDALAPRQSDRLPPSSRLPFTTNEHFVGRDNELQQIAQLLMNSKTVAIGERTVATTGLGGIGKTQLAVEFAHRYGAYFAGGVFWVNCAERSAIESEIAQCGQQLLPNFDALNGEQQFQQVMATWREPLPRLLIFDNCDENAEQIINAYRPKHGGCYLLITSRQTAWQPSLNMQTIPLDTLAPRDAIRLLRSLTVGTRDDLDDEALGRVAEALGNFPLALHVAGCYLALYPAWSVDAYIERLNAQPLAWLDRKLTQLGETPTAHELSVRKTFGVSWERLDGANGVDKLAQRLFFHLSWFAPNEPIPRHLLDATTARDQSVAAWLDGKDEADRADEMSDAIRRLQRLGLIEQGAQPQTVKLHRLLCAYGQVVQREAGAADESRSAMENGLVELARELNDTGNPMLLRIWLPHLLHLTEMRWGNDYTITADLILCVAGHFYYDGVYQNGVRFNKRAVEIRKKVLGELHPDTAIALNNLAELYRMLGEYELALPLFEEGLEIRERSFGMQHQATATGLNNLAQLYRMIGEYELALPLFEKALLIRQELFGEWDYDTATSLNNLASLYQKMREYELAQSLYEQSLTIMREVLDVGHPALATTLNNLAGLYRLIGKYKSARHLYDECLEIRCKVLGERHPVTATSLNNSAQLYEDMGEYELADKLYEESLAILLEKLGEQHHYVASVLNNLSGLYVRIGQFAEAEVLMERSIEILMATLSENHPDTRRSINNLAIIRERLNDGA